MPENFSERYRSLISQVEVVDQSSQWEADELHHSRPRFERLYHALHHYMDDKRDVIVDLGCGNGKFLYLSSNAGFNRLIGVDYFASKEESYLSDIEHAEIINADFNEPGFLEDFDSDFADCVVSTETFEHLLNYPLGYLQEAWRILRPGGLLLFSVPNPANLQNAVRLLLGKSYQWGIVEFAKTPKLDEQGHIEPMWNIHFMEYAPSDMEEIFNELPNAQVVDKQFAGANASPYDQWAKRILKDVLRITGLRDRRLFARRQLWILRKKKV